MINRKIIEQLESEKALCRTDIIVYSSKTDESWQMYINVWKSGITSLIDGCAKDTVEITIAGYYFDRVDNKGNFDPVEVVTSKDRLNGYYYYVDANKTMWVKIEDLIGKLEIIKDELKNIE